MQCAQTETQEALSEHQETFYIKYERALVQVALRSFGVSLFGDI